MNTNKSTWQLFRRGAISGLARPPAFTRSAFTAASFGVLVLMASLVGCGPGRPGPTPSSPPQAAVEEHVLTLGQGELFARRTAPPDPVASLLVLHGGPGMSSGYLLDLEQLASMGIEVIAFDQRGSGASGRPDARWTLAAYHADVEAVVDALATAPLHLFGHSWGGLLAMTYAANHPEQVESLVLFGSAPPTRDALQRADASFQERVAELRQADVIGPPPEDPEDYLAWVLPSYFHDPGFAPPGALANQPIQPQVNRATWQALGAFDSRQELSGLGLPILFFYGESDPFGRSMAEASLEALETAQIEVVWLTGCGHFWHECPLQVLPRVAGFLRQQSAVP